MLLNFLHNLFANAVYLRVQVTQELIEKFGVLVEAIICHSVFELADSGVFVVLRG